MELCNKNNNFHYFCYIQRKKKKIRIIHVKRSILLLRYIVHLKQFYKTKIIKFWNLYYNAKTGELSKSVLSKVLMLIDACN